MRLDPQIDTVILGCTHYPLLLPKIHKYIPRGVRIIAQGEYVASSLQSYFQRHPDMEQRCTKNGQTRYLTTENPEKFKEQAKLFLHEDIEVYGIPHAEESYGNDREEDEDDIPGMHTHGIGINDKVAFAVAQAYQAVLLLQPAPVAASTEAVLTGCR